MKKIIFFVQLLVLTTISAFAQSTNACLSVSTLSLPLNTATDNAGAILPDGSPEAHWTALSGLPVSVGYRANFPASQWVTTGDGTVSAESYQLAFCVSPCQGIDSVHLNFRMNIDNSGCVYLDGILLPLTWFTSGLSVASCSDGFGGYEPMLPGRGYVCNVTMPIAAGSHLLRVDISNQSNSMQGIDLAGTITGFINPALTATASISGATTTATGLVSPLCAAPTGNCFAYTWSNAANTACTNVGAGCYTVTVTNSCTGCTATATQCVVDTTITQQTPCTIHSSMVAKYKFSGNAVDSKHSNDGTVFHATLTADRFGTPNSAYHFDGTAEIDMGNGADFQMSGSSFSISVWAKPVTFYPNNGTNSFTIVGKRGILAPNGGCDPNYGFGINGATHKVGTGYRPDVPSCGSLQVLPSPTASDTTWHHYVAVYDRLGNLDLYQDNVLVNSVSMLGLVSGETFNVPYGNFKVGSNDVWNTPGSIDEHFIGDIDDIAVFRCALTPAQIDTLFHTDASFHYTAVTAETRHTSVSDAPSFTIYPNPTSGTVHIDYQTILETVSQITLTNSLGQTLQNITPSNDKQADLDLGKYAVGLYYLSIQTADGSQRVCKVVLN